MKQRLRTIGYVRVSTSRQSAEGVSLDAQRAKLRAYAELYDLDLLDVIEDAGESAASLERPGLQRALGMLRAGDADALLVVKLDRLTRSVRDLGALLDMGPRKGRWRLLSVGEQLDTGSAAGRMVLNLLAVVSQWEREAIGERTREGMAHLKRLRRSTGKPPFGFRVVDGPRDVRRDGTEAATRVLEPEPGEQSAIRLVHELHGAGKSVATIVADLAASGVRSRAGTPISRQTVYGILRRATDFAAA